MTRRRIGNKSATRGMINAPPIECLHLGPGRSTSCRPSFERWTTFSRYAIGQSLTTCTQKLCNPPSLQAQRRHMAIRPPAPRYLGYTGSRAPLPFAERLLRLQTPNAAQSAVLNFAMPGNRRDMTVRIVPLRSREASESRVGGTAVDRLNLVAVLSKTLWARTRRPLPAYTRATMPVVFIPLHSPSGHD